MDIKSQDFPLYELVDRLGAPGAEIARADFAKAQIGNCDEKYYFAMGIYTLANPERQMTLPGQTKEMTEKTLQSCLAVFEEIGAAGNGGGAFMSAYCYVHGQGCAKDAARAMNWIQKAEAIVGPQPSINELRRLLAPKSRFFSRRFFDWPRV